MESDPAIHHEGDPPDEVSHHISTDEEGSQESTTLKDAMKPLPDTQLSQLEPSEKHQKASAEHHEVGARLITRPQDTDIDPAASFTYGKPIKITPGQFSRVVPSRPRNPIAGVMLDNDLPSVRGGPNIEKPKAVASDQVRRLSRPISRQPPLLEDHQQHMPSDSIDQLTVSRTSSADRALLLQERDALESHRRGVESDKTEQMREHPSTDSHGRHTFPAVTREGLKHPQLYQQQASRTSLATTQAREQKHRLSLPNDTSVSSPQVPDHPPRNGPSRQPTQVNRPLRDLRRAQAVNTPTNRTTSRSSAHGSNISKKRSGHHASAPGTVRPSQMRLPRTHDESPTSRRHGTHSAMTSSQGSSIRHDPLPREPGDLEYLAGGIVQSLNSLFQTLKQKTEQKDMEMALMERRAAKQQSKLSQYKRQAEDKINIIQELEQSHAKLENELSISNQQLADRSEKTLKLEDKCRQYKEYLNSAIAEQQGLYKAANAKCEDAIAKMRESEHKQKAVSEQERRHVEATRERLSQIVKSTVAEYKSKEQQFADKIEALNQKLQEQEANMSRERETMQKLLQQDEVITYFQETITSVQDAIKSIGSQVEEVAVKVTDVASRQVNQDRTVAKETQAKLDNIAERLSALDQQAVPSADIVRKLQEANEKIFASILDHVHSSHAEAQASVQKLTDSIEDYMEDFWAKLEDREDVLTELLEQIKAENEELEINLQLKDEECIALFERLSQTEAMIQQRENELRALKEEISEVEQAQARDVEEVAHAEVLRDKYEKLERDLAEKARFASELQSRLHESESARATQNQEHVKSTDQLQKLLQQREEEAQAAQKAAVEMARKEVMLDMIKAQESIQTLLNQAEEQREALQDELDTARQKILAMEEEDKRNCATVSNLQSELQTAQSISVRLRDEASQTGIEHQQLMEQHTALIRALEAKLADKDKSIAELSKDAQIYNKQARKALNILKQWARENQGVREFVYEIERAEQGHFGGVDSKFKPLIQIDMLHRAIFQYCQAQKEAAPSTVGSQRDALSTAPGRFLDRFRRVTVKSPFGDASSPRPPSVQTEQTRRRTAGPPKSIMRVPSYSDSPVAENDKEEQCKSAQGEHSGQSAFTGKIHGQSAGAMKGSHDEEAIRELDPPGHGSFGTRIHGRSTAAVTPHQEEKEVQREFVEAGSVHNRGLFNRGPYNRLVAGTKSWPEGFNSRSQSQKTKSATENPSDQDNNTGEAYHAQQPQKRKSVFPREAEVPRKRIKTNIKRGKSLSLFSTPHSSSGQQTERQPDMSVPSAPRKSGHRSNTVGLEASSPTRVSLSAQNQASQGPNVVSGSIRTSPDSQNMSSQDSSQNPNAPYYQHHCSNRGNEESQDSITHSQDVR